MNTSAIQVKDLTYLATTLRSDLGTDVMMNSVNQYIRNDGKRVIYTATPIGLRCRVGQEQLAVNIICKAINHIKEFSDEDIPGFLGSRINKIDMFKLKPSDPDMIICSYPALGDVAVVVLAEDFEFMNINSGLSMSLEEIDDLLKN